MSTSKYPPFRPPEKKRKLEDLVAEDEVVAAAIITRLPRAFYDALAKEVDRLGVVQGKVNNQTFNILDVEEIGDDDEDSEEDTSGKPTVIELDENQTQRMDLS